MKISNIELNGFIVFLILLIISFYFRENFGKIQIYQTFVFLFIGLVMYLTGSGIINQAKVKTPKIIGDGIKSTVLSSKRKELSNGFYAFGLGAFEDDILMLKSIGKDGIVIVHKDSFKEIFENIQLIGNTDIKMIQDISFDWQDKIKEHFNYLPNEIYWIQPFKEFNEIKLENITESYVSDLNHRNKTLSYEVNQLKYLVSGMTSNTGKLIQFSSNMARISLKPFKKEVLKSLEREK